MLKAIFRSFIYFILGGLTFHYIVSNHCEINTYCWKASDVQKKQDIFFGFDENGENLEIIVTLPDSCGGTVEKAIQTPYSKEDILRF